MLSLQNLQLFLQAIHHPHALSIIDVPRSTNDGHVQMVIFCCCHQSRSVLAKARTSPADAGIQKAIPDALIQPNSFSDRRNVRPYLLCQLGNLVDEGDFQRKKGIGGILDHLRRGHIANEHRNFAETSRPGQASRGFKVLADNGTK